MKKAHAEINHGRWIVICPHCLTDGVISAMQVETGDVFVCPEEYPDIMAKTLIPNPRISGALNSVPDEVLREETRRKAAADGNVYEIVFPPENKQIEAVLRVRPRDARNWFAGVSLAELKEENKRTMQK